MSTLFIGVLRRPHGIRGALKVESYSGEYEHFRNLKEVELVFNGHVREARIRSVEVHNAVPVITFVGVETPEEARKLTGWEIQVPRTAAAPLAKDEFYNVDLVGLNVFADGVCRGTVTAVIDGGQASLLEIAIDQSGEDTSGKVLVPFMEEYVGTVDLQTDRLDIRKPWILDFE